MDEEVCGFDPGAEHCGANTEFNTNSMQLGVSLLVSEKEAHTFLCGPGAPPQLLITKLAVEGWVLTGRKLFLFAPITAWVKSAVGRLTASLSCFLPFSSFAGKRGVDSLRGRVIYLQLVIL